MASDACSGLHLVRLHAWGMQVVCSTALITLKKGSKLIKYSRKGKPKIREFRLSSDENTLVWYSHNKEKCLRLSSVSKVIPGQRTAVFRRFLRPEKDYLSFSLIYKNGQRSLDLVCKDQAEVEVWFSTLESLITSCRLNFLNDGQTDRVSFSEDVTIYQDSTSYDTTLDIASSITRSFNSAGYSTPNSLNSIRADVGSDRVNMLRASTGDNSRVSISSAPSSSSQSSGLDDIESLGDVYVWGEVWTEVLPSEGSSNYLCSKTDFLIPKPLESDVVLDVQQIACGSRHIGLTTRQGEVFTWGEELGGRLGHGTDTDICRPKLVESLAVSNVEYIACGEFHTCVVTASGDLYDWGDGSYNAGLLGHGTGVSHWLPKRVSGPLEGLQVLSVACGSWHSALTMSSGKLFTFGDGTFGSLGHGDRESVAYPKEVEALSGFRAMKVACGVWHSAAIVEISGQASTNAMSRKLFTWGDGDKNRLGHGDKEAKLVPTCVQALVDHNFHQVACGHSMTVALATSGHVFTMGSSNNGQLGNPKADGKQPCMVQDKLGNELVEEISCGSNHVAALTSRSEVYTWGMGANGRLGHGSVEDKKKPTLVDALKDRHVKSISCGSNFTTCICIHKWVSGADQSVCSGCRQPFGFTRKRHNCYNCGLVHCHACSSRKVLKAALAPTPGKPHRVCDSCFMKLKAADTGVISSYNKRNVITRRSIDIKDKLERPEIRPSRLATTSPAEPVKYQETKNVRNETKPADPMSMMKASQVPAMLQFKDMAFAGTFGTVPTTVKSMTMGGQMQMGMPMFSPSPPSKKPSPPPATASPLIGKVDNDGLKKTNELLNQDISKLQSQVNKLKQKCETQDEQLQKAERKAKQAASMASEESARRNTVLDFVKHLDSELKVIADRVPGDVADNLKTLQSQSERFLAGQNSNLVEITGLTGHDIGHHRSSSTGSLPVSQDGSSGNASGSSIAMASDSPCHRIMENNLKAPGDFAPKYGTHGEVQLIEQFEPGVYVTLIQLRDGTKVFKRVRFSKRRFAEQQAEEWWRENQERVFKKYNHPTN
uniref:FYVE-type domain-containing protein n=1 Tax=Oryza barthii TaxID=65489 RepID=A0A0D3GAE3_9ORYZ